eukprot:6032439-Lingulodinium_polyedra.AAC.1
MTRIKNPVGSWFRAVVFWERARVSSLRAYLLHQAVDDPGAAQVMSTPAKDFGDDVGSLTPAG